MAAIIFLHHTELTSCLLLLDTPHTEDIVVTPAQSFPVDLYVLIDLSQTMADDLTTLRRISEKLGKSGTDIEI